MNKQEIEKLYDDRYPQVDAQERYSVFIQICKNYFQKFVPENSENDILVDIAAGHCDFVNNIDYKGKRVAYDLSDYVKENAEKNVKVIIDDIANLKSHFKNDSVSLFFASNFLEHIPKDSIQQLFTDCYNLLKGGVKENFGY